MISSSPRREIGLAMAGRTSMMAMLMDVEIDFMMLPICINYFGVLDMGFEFWF